MKSLKSILLVGAAALAAALFVGAAGKGDSRPSFVAAEKWIPLNDRAGFALTSEKGDSVGAELYLKTEMGWRRGRVENPVTMLPVTR
jgi:hypothetical protein